MCLQLSSRQPSSTTTVDIRPTPQSPLPSKALLPQVTPALPKLKSSQVRPPTNKKAGEKSNPSKAFTENPSQKKEKQRKDPPIHHPSYRNTSCDRPKRQQYCDRLLNGSEHYRWQRATARATAAISSIPGKC